MFYYLLLGLPCLVKLKWVFSTFWIIKLYRIIRQKIFIWIIFLKQKNWFIRKKFFIFKELLLCLVHTF